MSEHVLVEGDRLAGWLAGWRVGGVVVVSHFSIGAQVHENPDGIM